MPAKGHGERCKVCRPHGMAKSSQILLGDQTRWGKFFHHALPNYISDTNADARSVCGS